MDRASLWFYSYMACIAVAALVWAGGSLYTLKQADNEWRAHLARQAAVDAENKADWAKQAEARRAREERRKNPWCCPIYTTSESVR